MTNEELVKKYQLGDRAALNQIIEKNEGIVRVIARKYQGYCISALDIDDLMQEGYLGLIKAAKRYKCDHAQRAMFSTYAFMIVGQVINDYVNTSKKRKEDISIFTPIGDDLEIGDTLQDDEDYICEVERSIYYQELRDEMHKAISENLTVAQREVIEMKYGIQIERMSVAQICDLMQIKECQVDALELSALHRLRISKWGRMKWLEMKKERGMKY